jgi:hypothetical protein
MSARGRRSPGACVFSCLALLFAGCTTKTSPPPPTTVSSVAVLSPSNRTGDGLLVAGTSLLEKYAFRTDRVTVPDVLASLLRMQLARRGFAVVAPDVLGAGTQGRTAGSADAAVELARHAHVDASALWVAIDRWEPDQGVHPDFVIVGIEAGLVDPATGKTLWHTRRRPSPVPTPGAVTLGSAYEIAAQKVTDELLASWGTRGTPAR